MRSRILPAREARVRLRSGLGRGAARPAVRALVVVAGLLAFVSRTAASVLFEPAGTSLARRLAALAGVVLDVVADPARAIVGLALVTTVSCAIAAWRRSAAAGLLVATTLVVLLGQLSG